MQIVIDTNILVSALLNEASLPARLLTLWRLRHFHVVTSTAQLDEIGRVTRYAKLREYLNPVKTGRLVNNLRELATIYDHLPNVADCSDPNDNFLLAMVEKSEADFLITGDKADLISMERYAGARIVTVRQFLEVHKLI